jgi:hypothetical protein
MLVIARCRVTAPMRRREWCTQFVAWLLEGEEPIDFAGRPQQLRHSVVAISSNGVTIATAPGHPNA